MGVSLGQVYSHVRPLLGLSEHVTVIPAGKEISVSNPAFKVLYFFTGELLMTLEDGSRYEIHPGDVVVLPRPCLQHYRPTRGGEADRRYHALVISLDVETPLALARRRKRREGDLTLWLRNAFPENRHWSNQALEGGQSLWSTAIGIRRAFEGQGPWMRLLACELARLMVLRIAAAAGFARPPHPSPDRERLEILCEKIFACNAAPEAGTPFFEQYFGFNPLTFLHRLRVDRAKSLLLNSSTPVGQIARQVGFSSPGSFSRVFRTFAGLSPNQYRRGHAANTLFSIRQESPRQLRTSDPAEHPAPWKWRIHSGPLAINRGSAHLILVLKGNASVDLPGQSILLSATENTVLLANNGWLSIHGNTARVAVLALEGFEGRINLGKVIGRPGWKRIDHGLAEWTGPLREMLLCRPLNRYQRLLLHSHTSALVYESLAFASAPSPAAQAVQGRQPSEVLVSFTKEYLNKHYSRPLTLGEIAYAVGVSEEHLARVFRAATGKTVMRHLFSVRATMARRLLNRSRLSLSEIAYACGFQTVGHFYRTFRSVVGTTPGAFRNGEK